MRKRYEALNDENVVARNVKMHGGFLPLGHLLPKPEWLEPTKDDVAAAARSDRPPGLSVWDYELASHQDACWWRDVDPTEYKSFRAAVSELRGVAARHDRPLSIVGDPLETEGVPRLEAEDSPTQARLRKAALGHSLVEGIKRPTGASKKDHKNFREELARRFSPVE